MENPEPTEAENEQAGTQRHADEEAMRGANEEEAPTQPDSETADE